MLIVRHGQASFGAENYDVLSALGITQSRRLGAWLAQNSAGPVKLWSGPLRRQLDTAKYMLKGALSEGGSLPEPEIVDGLRELPGAELVRSILPRLDADIPADIGTNLSAIELALDAWANDKVDVDGLETFAAFEARIVAALTEITSKSSPDRRDIIVTSAGPLAIAARLAFGLAPGPAIKLGSVIANTGATELTRLANAFRMTGFNSTRHLSPDQITYI